MKKILLAILLGLCSAFLHAQDNHLEIAYDFDGEDFDNIVRGMVGANDSLYVVTTDPNSEGQLFRIDENGNGFSQIHSFQGTNIGDPRSLIGNDTILYGTTRSSDNGGGAVFKYSLVDYSFEIIKDFSSIDFQEVELKFITDSVIWGNAVGNSQNGSIFTLSHDGSVTNVIYDNTNETNGFNPTDFEVVDGKLYMTFYNGGGIQFVDQTGSSNFSGSIGVYDISADTYDVIIQGEDGKGTQPSSIKIIDSKLFGIFDGAGNTTSGRYFRSDLNGSNFEDLGSISGAGRGQLTLTDDNLLFGISSEDVFSIDPETGDARTYSNFNSTIGRDATAGPTFFNGSIFISTQQGGPSNGGTILKWFNTAPSLTSGFQDELINEGDDLQYNLTEFFEDAEDDEITFEASVSSQDVLSNSLDGSALTLSGVLHGVVVVTITASDGWGGALITEFNVEVNAPTEQVAEIQDIIVQEGFANTQIDLSDFFQDRNGDEIIYTVTESTSEVVETSITSGTLTFSELGIGTATITVEATDEKSDPVSQEFQVRVNGTPTILDQIDDVLINEGFNSQVIDLSNFFSDPDEDDLTYSVTVFDETVLTASEENGELTIVEVGLGGSDITISVDDQFGGMNELSFNFEINGLPRQINDLGITQSEPGFGTIQVDLSDKFSDPDDDPLSFTIQSSDPTLIDASIDGTNLTITEVSTGTASVTLTVSDDRGGSLELTVLDIVLSAGLESSESILYPSPVSSELKLNKTNIDYLEIIDLNGQLVLKASTPKSNINVDSLVPGVYLVKYTIENKEYSEKLVKK